MALLDYAMTVVGDSPFFLVGLGFPLCWMAG